MSYCSNCGTHLKEKERFCPECGHETSPTAAKEALIDTAKKSERGPTREVLQNVANKDARALDSQKKKASGCKIAAMILGGLAVLGLVAIGGFIMLFGLMTKPLATAVDQHFALLKMGNDQAAYDGTAVEFRAVTSYDDYQDFLNLNPGLRTISGSSFSNSKMENGVGLLEGNLIAESGIKIPIVIRLQKEIDEWKVAAYEFPETF